MNDSAMPTPATPTQHPSDAPAADPEGDHRGDAVPPASDAPASSHDPHHHHHASELAHTLAVLSEQLIGSRPSKEYEPLVFLGGVVLATIAGFLNVVVLMCSSYPVTHVTGTVSRLSSDIASGNTTELMLILPLFACFITGSAISGIVIDKGSLRLGRPYGIAMLLEAALIGAGAVVLHWHVVFGVLLVAMAAGLQNAMASSYGGLIVRTTHMTGIATDLGFLIGRWIRHREVAGWKFMLLTLLLASFFVGGALGHFSWLAFHEGALWLPTGVLGIIGGVYFLWRKTHETGTGDLDQHLG
jgi:uncharacterized membrane protein YoaK (UPF0700 family)